MANVASMGQLFTAPVHSDISIVTNTELRPQPPQLHVADEQTSWQEPTWQGWQWGRQTQNPCSARGPSKSRCTSEGHLGLCPSARLLPFCMNPTGSHLLVAWLPVPRLFACVALLHAMERATCLGIEPISASISPVHSVILLS